MKYTFEGYIKIHVLIEVESPDSQKAKILAMDKLNSIHNLDMVSHPINDVTFDLKLVGKSI